MDIERASAVMAIAQQLSDVCLPSAVLVRSVDVLAAKAGRHQWQISVSDTAGCVWQTKQQRTSNWSQTCDLLLSSGVAHMQHTQHTQHCMAHSVTQACLLLFPATDTARGCRRKPCSSDAGSCDTVTA